MKKQVLLLTSLALVVHSSIADPLTDYRAKLAEQRQQMLDARKQADIDARRGWHWYNDEEPQPEEPPADEDETAQTPPPEPEKPVEPEQPKPPQTVKLDNQWMRENMPRLLDDAMNNSNDENKVAAYWMVHRLLVDQATKFQDSTRRLYMTHPELSASENARRPTSQIAVKIRDAEAAQSKRAVLQAIFERAGIWFFYRSDCRYCQQEAPVLKAIEREFMVNMLPISLDGLPLPGGEFPDYVTDRDYSRASMLGVRNTPSIYLVTNDGSQIHMLAEGIIPGEELVDTILYVARKAGVINEQELQQTREVQQVYTNNQDGPMEVPREWVEGGDPKQLVDALKDRMESVQPFGSTPAGAQAK